MTLPLMLIRIHTTISGLRASQSKTLAKACKWIEACIPLVNAITKSCNAMILKDSEILGYFQCEQEGFGGGSNQPRRALERDADIVHVAIQSVVRVKDRYQELSQSQMSKLERISLPQWES
jgi:hypothetical protein